MAIVTMELYVVYGSIFSTIKMKLFAFGILDVMEEVKFFRSAKVSVQFRIHNRP